MTECVTERASVTENISVTESECDREHIFQMLHTAGGACI